MEKCWGRCEKVYWDVEEVREEVWGSVGGGVLECGEACCKRAYALTHLQSACTGL